MVHDSVARRLLFGLAAVGGIGGMWAGGGLPEPLALAYAVMSLLTFVLYGADKRAAQRDTPRIRERTLQLCGLACGWPGGLLAQAVFRHKHRKAAFQWVFFLCVITNIVVVMALLRLLSPP